MRKNEMRKKKKKKKGQIQQDGPKKKLSSCSRQVDANYSAMKSQYPRHLFNICSTALIWPFEEILTQFQRGKKARWSSSNYDLTDFYDGI